MFALTRARTMARFGAGSPRVLSRLQSSSSSSRPPRPVNDSTSALDYKQAQRHAPPPLPERDVPRSRTAEEAVTNILYNTPPPSSQPYKKHILNCLVQNEPGVLSRVSGILAGRGFNIDSLVVCRTEVRDLSRMCIVLSGQDTVVEQARRQLEDLVPVWAVLDYTDTRTIARELLLVKVSILGPEYLEQQLKGGPSHDPRAIPAGELKFELESALAKNMETGAQQAHAADPSSPSSAPAPPSQAPLSHSSPLPASMAPASSPVPLTPSQALQMKHQHLASISTLASHFGAKLVDVSDHSVIVEMTGKTSRVEAFLRLVEPFGVLESARSGLMVLPRTPIGRGVEESDSDVADDVGVVDASLLPPG